MITLLCPTRGRPEQLGSMLHSAVQTCAKTFNAVFYVDADDGPTQEALRGWATHPQVQVSYVVQQRRTVRMSNMWNLAAAVALAVDPATNLLFVDDEAKFHTQGWDYAIDQQLARYDDGIALVHPDDGIHAELAAGYFATTPTWVKVLGRLTPREFAYGYADVWCLEVATAVDRNIYLPEVYIENLAPKLQPPDQTHLDNELMARASRPGDLYNETQPIRERDVRRLQRWIEASRGDA